MTALLFHNTDIGIFPSEIGEHIEHRLIQCHHAGGLFFAVDDMEGYGSRLIEAA